MWTREKGYIVGDPSAAAVGPLYSDAVSSWRSVAEPMYEGEKDVPKAVLDPVYMKIQALLAHQGASAEHAQGGRETARDIVAAAPLLAQGPGPLQRRAQRDGSSPPTRRSASEQAGLEQHSSRVALKAHLEALNKALKAQPDQASAKATIERLVKKGPQPPREQGHHQARLDLTRLGSEAGREAQDGVPPVPGGHACGFALDVAPLGELSDPGLSIQRLGRAAEAAGWDGLSTWDSLGLSMGHGRRGPVRGARGCRRCDRAGSP